MNMLSANHLEGFCMDDMVDANESCCHLTKATYEPLLIGRLMSTYVSAFTYVCSPKCMCSQLAFRLYITMQGCWSVFRKCTYTLTSVCKWYVHTSKLPSKSSSCRRFSIRMWLLLEAR